MERIQGVRELTEHGVWTFFCGSCINVHILEEIGVVPEEYEMAKLYGYDIRIRPLANLVRSG